MAGNFAVAVGRCGDNRKTHRKKGKKLGVEGKDGGVKKENRKRVKENCIPQSE
jgi:hypothetical protein